MNLASPIPPGESNGFAGVTPCHSFTMLLLVGFALAMLVMDYFKMRRAAALFDRIDPTRKPPPPGNAAPPAKGPGPGSDGPTPSPHPSFEPPKLEGPTGPQANQTLLDSVHAQPSGTASTLSGVKAVTQTSAAAESPANTAAPWRGQLRIASIVTEIQTSKRSVWLRLLSVNIFLLTTYRASS